MSSAAKKKAKPGPEVIPFRTWEGMILKPFIKLQVKNQGEVKLLELYKDGTAKVQTSTGKEDIWPFSAVNKAADYTMSIIKANKPKVKKTKKLKEVEPLIATKELTKKAVEVAKNLQADINAIEAGVPPRDPKVQVQQLLGGKYVEESTEIKHYQVLEAAKTGLLIRYTEKAEEAAQSRVEALDKKGGKDAENFKAIWATNKQRATKNYKASIKPELEIRARRQLALAFWDPGKEEEEFIERRAEAIEYRTIRTFAFAIRVRELAWHAKLDKWVRELNPLKPKNPQKRTIKAAKAKAKISAWISDHAKPVKTLRASEEERVAYVQLLQEHVFKTLDEAQKARPPTQAQLPATKTPPAEASEPAKPLMQGRLEV